MQCMNLMLESGVGKIWCCLEMWLAINWMIVCWQASESVFTGFFIILQVLNMYFIWCFLHDFQFRRSVLNLLLEMISFIRSIAVRNGWKTPCIFYSVILFCLWLVKLIFLASCKCVILLLITCWGKLEQGNEGGWYIS